MKNYFLFIEVTFLPKLDLQKTRTHIQILYRYILILQIFQRNVWINRTDKKIKPRYNMH